MVNLKQWGHGPRLQHEGDGKPTRSVHLSVTAKIATDARPGGPATKHQPSPEESLWELENRPRIGPRPGGPAAKFQPSPEGLGINPEDDLSAGGAALNLSREGIMTAELSHDLRGGSVWELENRPRIGPRPGGPAAKLQPSPEGLGINPEDDLSAGGAALNLPRPAKGRGCGRGAQPRFRRRRRERGHPGRGERRLRRHGRALRPHTARRFEPD